MAEFHIMDFSLNRKTCFVGRERAPADGTPAFSPNPNTPKLTLVFLCLNRGGRKKERSTTANCSYISEMEGF